MSDLARPRQPALPRWSVVAELFKPRLTAMLALVALCSFAITGGFAPGGSSWGGAALTGVSVLMLSFGIFPLNQWLERDADGAMVRTRGRPLPSGRLRPAAALRVGLGFLAASLAFSWCFVNRLQCLVAALTALGYLALYTPLKYRSAVHTAVGALPGATPPLMGALAATGRLDGMAWVLGGLLLFWQFPHFLSLGMLHRDDYAKASVRILPASGSGRAWLAGQLVFSAAALMAVSCLPWLWGFAGPVYGVSAIAAALAVLVAGLRAARRPDAARGRVLFRVAMAYLPIMFLFLTAESIHRF